MFPLALAAGIYLAEFGRGTRLANAIRFTADVLNGVPSIVMGMAAYALIVSPHVAGCRSWDISLHSPAAWRWAS